MRGKLFSLTLKIVTNIIKKRKDRLMKKRDIIKEKYEFTDIINKGKRVSNKYYSIYYIYNKDTTRFGISIPKKTGKAVIRNKIKRQVKSIIDNNKNSVQKSFDYVIIIRKGLLDLKYLDRERELLSLMKKIGDKE